MSRKTLSQLIVSVIAGIAFIGIAFALTVWPSISQSRDAEARIAAAEGATQTRVNPLVAVPRTLDPAAAQKQIRDAAPAGVEIRKITAARPVPVNEALRHGFAISVRGEETALQSFMDALEASVTGSETGVTGDPSALALAISDVSLTPAGPDYQGSITVNAFSRS